MANKDSRLFRLRGFDRLLFERASEDDFRRYIKSHLRWELMKMLPAIETKLDSEGYVGILTYYSNYLANLEAGDREFRRVPVSTLKLDRNFQYMDSYQEKDFSSGIGNAKSLAQKCLTGTLQWPNEFDPLSDEAHNIEIVNFFEAMQNNVLAPVNLAEALNVDFHLPAARYRKLADDALFSNVRFESVTEIAELKARSLTRWTDSLEKADRSVSQTKTRLDTPLFTSTAVQEAEHAFKSACDELRRLPIGDDAFDTSAACEDVMERLSKSIRFSFNNKFVSLASALVSEDLEYPSEISLRQLATSLLSCNAIDNIDGITLYDLYARCSIAQTEAGIDQSKLRAVPSLPFYVLALYWNGSYRDLLRYVTPPFLLDVSAIHIETVDLCDSPEDVMFQLCRYLMGLEDKQEPQQDFFADNVALMIKKNAVGNLAILRKADIDQSQLVKWTTELDWRLRGIITPMRRRERFSEKIVLETQLARLQERRAADLGTAFHELVQHLGTLGEALGATNRSVDKIPEGRLDYEELSGHILGAKDSFGIVAAVVEAQMNFAKNMPEDFSRLELDRRTLEKFFMRFDEWGDTASELWNDVSCKCEPHLIISSGAKVKLPFVSVYSLVRELLRNFMRYADTKRPALFTNLIDLDRSKIEITVRNGISNELMQNRQQFKLDRVNQFRAIATSAEEIDKYLGKNWIEHNVGIGMRGLFTNYLIRNFSNNPDWDAQEFNRRADTHMYNLRYTGSNKFGSVRAETHKAVEAAGETYELSICIELN